ncbi:MAG: DUF6134 family protein [Rhodospirillales bacterium]
MSFLRLPVLLALILFSGPVLAAEIGESIPESNRLDFTITRNGDVIGSHQVRFSRSGDQLTVQTEIAIKVTFAFITFYDYQHSATEVWRDGMLQSISARTNNDGAPEFVSIRREGDRLAGTSTRGDLDLPGDIGATSYWIPGYLDAGTWLDTQDGEILEMTHNRKGEEPVIVQGKSIPAMRSHSVANNGSEVDLWYAGRKLMKMQFKAFDDSILTYNRL